MRSEILRGHDLGDALEGMVERAGDCAPRTVATREPSRNLRSVSALTGECQLSQENNRDGSASNKPLPRNSNDDR